MRDVDVAGVVVVTFHAGAVLITLTRVVDEVENLTQGAADDVARQVCLVFRPLRLNHAACRVLILNLKTHRGPEVLKHRPNFFRRGIHVHPAHLAVAHDFGNLRHREQRPRLITAFSALSSTLAASAFALTICGRCGTV